MIDQEELKKQFREGNDRVWSNSGRSGNAYFFNLRRPLNHYRPENYYWAEIRLVVGPDPASPTGWSPGFSYRLVHRSVGRPGREPKTYVCGHQFCSFHNKLYTICRKFDDPNCQSPPKECPVCDLLSEAVNDTAFMADSYMFPQRRTDGVVVQVPKTVEEILKGLRVTHQMIWTLIEPQYFGNPQIAAALKPDNQPDIYARAPANVQVFYMYPKVLCSTITKFIQERGADFFFSPHAGHSLLLKYWPDKDPRSRYEATICRQVPVDPSVYALAPNCEQFSPQLKSVTDIRTKINDIFPDWAWG